VTRERVDVKIGRPINLPRRSDGNQEEERRQEEVSWQEVISEEIIREEGHEEESGKAHT